MELNCCDLDCPMPVIKTKQALEQLQDNSILVVLVNSVSSIENVKRFASNNNFSFEETKLDNNVSKITIVKGYECNIVQEEILEKHLDKTFFIKDDKIGVDELGDTLMEGFLKTTLEFKELPKNIVLVNRGIFLTTKNQKTIDILKEFEKRGTQIYTCGLCMDFYKIDPSSLTVGMIGNAYDSMDMLLHTQTITL
jgi:selenium metabolism protein YedF